MPCKVSVKLLAVRLYIVGSARRWANIWVRYELVRLDTAQKVYTISEPSRSNTLTLEIP